jgi:hypothetical protein
VSIFLLTLFVAWTISLLVLKFYYGAGRVGCAAGGEIIDVRQLKKVQHLPKKDRKQRILRNWRAQTACLLACLGLLPVSMVMLQLGLTPFIASLYDIREINDEVDSRAYRGIEIIAQLQETLGNLQTIQSSGIFNDHLSLQKICPNHARAARSGGNSTNSDLNALLHALTATSNKNVTAGIKSAESLLQSYDLESVAGTLYQVTNATDSVDDGINSLYSNYWILKLLIVIMDLVVIFIIVGILFTKDNTDFPAYQRFAALFLLPIFCLALVATVTGTCISVSMAMVNAGTWNRCHFFVRRRGGSTHRSHRVLLLYSDFCAGGDGVSSPVGTIQQALVENGYHHDSIPYQALDYYGSVSATRTNVVTSLCLFHH